MVVGSVAAYFDRISNAFLPWPCLFYGKARQCGWEGHLVIPALQFSAVKPHQPITDAASECSGLPRQHRQRTQHRQWQLSGMYNASSVAQFLGARI